MPLILRPMPRVMSPSGGSTFTTSAPRSARMRLAKGPARTRLKSKTLTPSSRYAMAKSAPCGGPAGHAVVELDAGAVQESAHGAVAARRGDEMDDVGVTEMPRGLCPRGVADAVIGVEVVDDLEDDAIGVRPGTFSDGTGREVD